MRKMRLILASGSPRRRQLLKQAGFSFTCIVSDAEERFDPSLSPEEIVKELALIKARAVASLPEAAGAVVLGSDTIVVQDGAVLGKPADEADAARMLRLLSGREHLVFTGVALLGDGKEIVHAECTRVFFRPLTDAEIASYVASGEPMDKAGAYGIQGFGSSLVTRVEGDFFSVMGLPVCRTGQLLKEQFGILPSMEGKK